MTAPAVAATNTSAVTTAATSHTVNLPSGIVSGNLLIIEFASMVDPGTIDWATAGYTAITNFQTIRGGVEIQIDAAYRQATGSEGSTVAIGTSLSTKSAHIAYRIEGAENPSTQVPEATTGNNGGTANTANGPALTPTGGSKDYLWLTAMAIEGEGTDPTAAPTDYTNFLVINTGITGAVGINGAIGSAERQLTASSEDPGAFTHPAEGWVAQTIAIHPAGASPQTVTGSLFTKAPTFFTGFMDVVGGPQSVTGSALFAQAPTFFQGRVRRAVPTGLVEDEIGVMGHSNTDIYIRYYRTMSTLDLVTTIDHGGIRVETWGDPGDAGYTAAWNKLFLEEPPGGYRAFLVMLLFLGTYTMPQLEGYADHISARLATDFPTIEYIWWMPMSTYFSTAGLDGDAEDLVAIDRWGANPLALDEHASAGSGVVQGSEESWAITEYAIANGYADDYGPWVNLHESITDTDGQHATEAEGGFPPPNGQTHGGDIFFAFFENGSQGLVLPAVFTKAPTFFVGTVAVGAVDLAGALFVNAPSFFVGVVDLIAGTQTVTGTLFVKAPTFPTGTVFASTSQIPSATVSNDGWDTAPLAGQSIHTYIAADDADYITVTVP